MTYQDQRSRFQAWCLLYSNLDLAQSPTAKVFSSTRTEEAWQAWLRVAQEDDSLIAELRAKLDICKRYAEGELEDQALLANDYGGTGWEKDPACRAVEAAVQRSYTLPNGWVAVPRDATDEMVEAAEAVEDLHRRGTPNTWKRVFTQMVANSPKCPAPIATSPQLTSLQKDAVNLLFAVHDAWPYVHQWCTIDSIKNRLGELIQKHGEFADFHRRAVDDVVITTDEAGNCVAVTRQDDDGRISKVIWQAPTPSKHRAVFYGFNRITASRLKNGHSIECYGVYEHLNDMWWCRVATRPDDLYEHPDPIGSREPADMASCIVAIGTDGTKTVLKNRYPHQPTLPPVLPTFTFRWVV